MGASFANVQVRVHGDDAGQRVVAALRALLVTPETSEVDSDGDADRTLMVVESGTWVAVYDELTDMLDAAELEALAEGLSAALDAPAVTALVADSDVLVMELFERGKRVADFDSAPAVSGRRRRKLKLDKWSRHLAPGHESGELAQVFAEKQLFAEHTLGKVAVLLGMDARQACVGYRYHRNAAVFGPKDASQAPREWLLRLRRAARPKYERLGTEPTHLVPFAGGRDNVTEVGQPFQEGFSVRNDQRASRGLSIVLRGPAFDEGLVRLSHAQLVVGELERQEAFPEATFIEQRETDGTRIWVAEFPELELPAGSPSASFESELLDMAAFSAMQRAQVHANVHGDVVAAGTAEYQVTFVPHEARVTGQLDFWSDVTVRPRARRPLRAPDDTDVSNLERATVLFGLASCSGESPAMAELAAELAARWLKALPLYAEKATCRFHVSLADREAKAAAGGSRVRGLFRTKELRAWLEEPSLVDEVTIELVPPPSEQSLGLPTDGFSFSSEHGRSRSADASDKRCPTFCFWMSTQELSPDAVSAAEQVLNELMSAVFARGRGLQGLVGRWGGRPVPDHTPYETACDVYGQCTRQHSWLTRFLRGVTSNWNWLGPELVARVDRAALARVATIEDAGAGLRFRLKPEANLDDLELVLAELLPSEADHRAGMARFSGKTRRGHSPATE